MPGMNSESVDLIYLDPPFNSNRTYSAPIGSKAAGAAFKDALTLDDVDLVGGADVLDDAHAESHPLHRAPAAHGRGQAAAVQDAQAHALRQAGGQVRRVRPPLPVPELHGGAHRDTDHLDNLQLLCSHCNSVKGTMDQAAFKVKLSTMGLGA